MADTFDIKITAGKRYRVAFTWTYVADDGTRTILDPSGRILRIQARRNPQSDNVIASFTSVPGEHLGGAEGTVTLLGAVEHNIVLEMLSADTELLRDLVGNYGYDCDWIGGDGEPEALLEGACIISIDNTRPVA